MINPSDFSALSDQELKDELKKTKPSPLFDAFFIGFLVGIIVYSVVVNTWGLVTIIPLWIIYVFLKKSKRYEAMQNELKNRGL